MASLMTDLFEPTESDSDHRIVTYAHPWTPRSGLANVQAVAATQLAAATRARLMP